MGLRSIPLEEKVARGLPLNQTELSECGGYSRSTIGQMVREGLPLYHGKITLPEFRRWVSSQARKVSAGSSSDQSLRRAADRFYGPS